MTARGVTGTPGDRERLLVAVEHFGGDVGPGEALGALARGDGHAHPPCGVERESAQGLGERVRIAGGQQLPVETVAHDIAVARMSEASTGTPAANAPVRTMPNLSPSSEGA